MQSFRSLFFNIATTIYLLLSISACGSPESIPTPTPISGTTIPTLQNTVQSPSPTPEIDKSETQPSVIVINEFPHDTAAFTQGLVIENNVLYEGTGLYGQSSIRKVDLETGRVIKIRRLPAEYFGEGIVIIDNRLIQITWQSGIGFVYDLDSFQQTDTFTYDHEGWGITFDGTLLYMSDGTDIIHKLNPDNFSEVGTIQVIDDGNPITEINELEYIEGLIYANIWKTSNIAVINPETGQVKEWLDLDFLLTRFEQFPREINVLNGIAYNKITRQIYVTGKLWPKLFEIQITLTE
jgi:glutamine cyclotransferase